MAETEYTLETLPRVFTAGESYQLVIRAYSPEWVAAYENIFKVRYAECAGHGDTIEDAVTELCRLFEQHPSFKDIRDQHPA